MSTLVLRVRRGRRLLGTWQLDGEPLEMAIVDEASGRLLGRFTAMGGDDDPEGVDTAPAALAGPPPPLPAPLPANGGHDEVPVSAGAARLAGDDFTMPLPELGETTEPTSDLVTGETEESGLVERLNRSRPRPIPNLASRSGEPVEVDTLTGPADFPTQEASPDSLGGIDLLALDSGTSPTPVSGVPTAPFPPEDDLDLEGLEEDADEDPGHATSLGDAVAPAEVWVRRQSEWRSGGSLKPGQRAVSRGGWVRLRRDGALVVRPGPSLSGSATMVDGSTVEIARDEPPVELEAGASILLRAGEYGLYVRSEALPDGGLPEPG